MKKWVILASILILIAIPFASASIFDFLTGKSIDTTTTAITEQFKCVFADSNEMQKCYTNDGKFSCSGIGSCVADVSGVPGTQLIWKSSCGMEFFMAIDGTNKEMAFKCPSTTTTTSGGGTSTTATQVVQSSEELKEQVKCVFADTNEMQKCYSDDGRFGCSGIGTCIADVIGSGGEQKTWKSSCGGYAYTKMDGSDEYAEFKCEAIQPTATTPVAVEIIKEQVKCLFTNSDKQQECYGNEFKCSGIGSCVADVSGEKGKQITWKSSCGGYAYSVTDGNDEYAEFKCAEQPTVTPVQSPIAPTARIEKKVLMYVVMQDKCSPCDAIKKFIDELKQKYADVNVNYLFMPATAAPTQSYNLVVAAYIKRGVPTTFLDNKVWNGFNDDVAKDIENKVKSCLEQGCRVDPNPSIPDELLPYLSTYMTKAPLPQLVAVRTSKAPSEGNAREQITCIFHNSDVLINPHTARPEKCMTENGEFGCVWDGNVMVGEDGKRRAYCVIPAVEGVIGKKLTWKSSCGGYAYSVTDGNNENAEFKCVPATNVTAEQISGKGFMNAYWQCYDGLEFKSAAANCKSSEIWKKEAEEFCKNSCVSVKGEQACPAPLSEEEKCASYKKCGVNSFSVSVDCYLEAGKEGVVFTPLPAVPVEEEIERKKAEGIKETKIEEALICKDSCPFNNKCYPFGYRKADRYCSDNNAFITQLKADEACDNNFECKSNVCIVGKCLSESSINKILNWFKKIFKFGGGETEEIKGEVIDCGASSECMENAFKICKPAKISQGSSISEIIGLKGEKCVLKMTAGKESMTCKIENYELGTKNLGNMEQYCSGTLAKKLATMTTAKIQGSAVPPTFNSAVNAVKVSEDSNDKRYIFSVHDPDGIREFSIIKPDFGEVAVKVVPSCTKDFTAEREFSSSELPLRASVVDCGTPATRYELKVEMKISAAEKEIPKEVKVPAQTESLDLISACEKIRNPAFKYECTAMLKKDASDCELISEQVTRPYCYADVALAAKDSAICKKIEDSGHKGACEALVERDKDKCSDWIYADYCYRDVAALIGDTSVCDYIKYEGGKMTCKAVILKDVSLCQNTDSEDCYQMLALLTGDEKVCDELSKIKITGERPIAIANLTSEVSKCIKMAKKEITGCLFKSGSGVDCDLIPAFAKNPSLCENLKSDYEGFAERDLCYFNAVMNTADLLPPQLIVL